nr:hypothetical protein BaRGS_035194 [Batillaria attramentaria]
MAPTRQPPFWEKAKRGKWRMILLLVQDKEKANWIDGAEKLVVADYMNDRLHVVRVDAAGTCQFERYLAAGSGYLVKPTTLNTDVHGNLWIGCANGWVLQCKTVSS